MASACATSCSPVVSRSVPSACPSTTAAATFRRRSTVSCRATGGRCDNDGLLWLPRRDVMLSGVAAGLAWYPGLASGAPCQTGADKVNEKVLLCTDPTLPCPRRSEMDPVDFNPSVTRVRQPVHLLSPEYQKKYKEAVAKMKALPESNPLSFKAQAAIHQAYCDSYYKYHKAAASSAKDDPVFDVHFSWIFAPWHRMYIYFYERALGDLIGDDTFALPYWNWDAPAGMVVPPLFTDDNWWTKPDGTKVDNPLYDPNRSTAYLDKLVDLDYLNEKTCRKDYTPIPFESKNDQSFQDLVDKNLCTVYAQQVGKGPESFLGEKYCTDIKGQGGSGTLERMAHTAVHVWVGKAGPPEGKDCSAETGGVLNHSSKTKGEYSCKNDMGFLGSAANDPLFYSHHSNVDRMWHLWSTRFSGGKGITDPDWLDTSFVFYDNVKSPRKVRIMVRDVLDTSKLGYTYAESDKGLPWLHPKRKLLVPDGKYRRCSTAKTPDFPLKLAQCKVEVVLGVAVPGEQGGEKLLVIDEIEFNPQVNNKFDVAINVPADKALEVGPHYMEYAGSFAAVPGSGSGSGSGETQKTRVCLCITNVLSDIKVKAGGSVDVTFVLRTEENVTLRALPTIQIRNAQVPKVATS